MTIKPGQLCASVRSGHRSLFHGKFVLGLLGALALSACSDTVVEPSPELVQQAQQIAAQFVGVLQPTLQQAIQAGGPVNGIEVCATVAPGIARSLSEDSGWQVTRVSLKARNTATAVPDNWETLVLQEFDQRQRAGEAVEQLNKTEVFGGELRYMQAQATGPLCLSCHGGELAPEVRAALSQHYPDDMATGYLLGEIRGAISLRKQL